MGLKKIFSSFLSLRHKNNKFLFYLRGFLRLVFLKTNATKSLGKKLAKINSLDEAYIENRVNYYNKLDKPIPLSENVKPLKDFSYTGEMNTYFFDTWKYTRYFNAKSKFNYVFGDINYVPNEPAIVKSRPINEDNQNSVLLNLNKIRHFMFVNDKIPIKKKKDFLVWRGFVYKNHDTRVRFFEKFHNHPICNIGQINDSGLDPSWIKEKMSIDEHLTYKFILSIEGNDVATNLKWIMSSNSVAVMPTPRHETWFMEGTLIPDYHYLHIKDDFSDLEEKLNIYSKQPEKLEEISRNANEYVRQFFDKEQEDLISILVLKKYFEKTK